MWSISLLGTAAAAKTDHEVLFVLFLLPRNIPLFGPEGVAYVELAGGIGMLATAVEVGLELQELGMVVSNGCLVLTRRRRRRCCGRRC